MNDTDAPGTGGEGRGDDESAAFSGEVARSRTPWIVSLMILIGGSLILVALPLDYVRADRILGETQIFTALDLADSKTWFLAAGIGAVALAPAVYFLRDKLFLWMVLTLVLVILGGRAVVIAGTDAEAALDQVGLDEGLIFTTEIGNDIIFVGAALVTLGASLFAIRRLVFSSYD